MKYECEIVIDLPREKVIELFDDPEKMAKWQEGFQSFEPMSGEPGRPGAKSRLVYDMNGRRIEMVETITSRNLPEEFSGTYEVNGVYNWIQNRFYKVGENQTRWVTESEFKFSGLMKLLSIFMRGTFPKQTMAHMQNFKRFAEGG